MIYIHSIYNKKMPNVRMQAYSGKLCVVFILDLRISDYDFLFMYVVIIYLLLLLFPMKRPKSYFLPTCYYGMALFVNLQFLSQ